MVTAIIIIIWAILAALFLLWNHGVSKMNHEVDQEMRNFSKGEQKKGEK